ncbi:hypothetical protein [Microbacterium sp.]|uniref:hypothetical protein n=1 Tax=Microbacterium sp. TaxID=51671 RepID=UPI003F6E85BF
MGIAFQKEIRLAWQPHLHPAPMLLLTWIVGKLKDADVARLIEADIPITVSFPARVIAEEVYGVPWPDDARGRHRLYARMDHAFGALASAGALTQIVKGGHRHTRAYVVHPSPPPPAADVLRDIY